MKAKIVTFKINIEDANLKKSNRQLAIGNRQSKNPQSAIRNPQYLVGGQTN